MDFIITPYNKDRQLIRLEEECHCIVTLLHPEDPRSRYCPPSYRTIEVLYDEELGHFETFQHRLNRILAPQRCTARLVSTILRQFDGREVVMTAEHAAYLLNSDHRPRYDDIRAFVVSGCRPRADRLPINVWASGWAVYPPMSIFLSVLDILFVMSFQWSKNPCIFDHFMRMD